MAALVVFHGYGTRVWSPLKPVQVVLIVDSIAVCFHPIACSHINDSRIMLWQLIARLCILLFVEQRLLLVCRRRLYIVDISFFYRLTLTNKELCSIGRPLYLVAIIQSDGTILSKATLHTIWFANLMNHHIIFLYVCLPFSIGRNNWTCHVFFIHLHPMALMLATKSWFLWLARFYTHSMVVVLNL